MANQGQKMSLDTAKSLTCCNTISIEKIEEYRCQSALASSADRADIDLMIFLDQALLDNE
jgi:hypothetical protein